MSAVVSIGAQSTYVEEDRVIAVSKNYFRAYGLTAPRAWEFYVVEDGYLEMFTGYAEPWQAELLERLARKP